MSLHPEQWMCEDVLLQRLRTECALCGRRFDHPPQLHRHLLDAHHGATQEAAPYADHIVDNFIPHGSACICGSWQMRSIGHTCVVTLQLGILRLLCRREEPPPHFAMIPDQMDRWLLEGRWDSVWQHPEYAYVSSNYCSLCLNRMSSLGQLWDQMDEFHAAMLPVGIQQLMRSLESCRHAALPAGTFLLKSGPQHLVRCPIFLNCLLLLNVRHGPLSEHGGEGGRRALRAEAQTDKIRRRNKRRKSQGQRDSTQESELRSLCLQMGRLLLRQEDVLNSMSEDHTWVVFVDRKSHGILPHILAKTKQWHQQRKTQTTTQTLRSSLCQVIFEQMHVRLTELLAAKKGDPAIQKAIQAHLLTENMQLPDLMWDANSKSLQPQEGARTPVEVLQMLELCSREGTIQKLHALQNTNSQTNHVLPWRLQVSLRHGLTLMKLLDDLRNNSIWQYLLCRIRPWSQQRSSLAQSIQRSLPRASNAQASRQRSSN